MMKNNKPGQTERSVGRQAFSTLPATCLPVPWEQAGVGLFSSSTVPWDVSLHGVYAAGEKEAGGVEQEGGKRKTWQTFLLTFTHGLPHHLLCSLCCYSSHVPLLCCVQPPSLLFSLLSSISACLCLSHCGSVRGLLFLTILLCFHRPCDSTIPNQNSCYHLLIMAHETNMTDQQPPCLQNIFT